MTDERGRWGWIVFVDRVMAILSKAVSGAYPNLVAPSSSISLFLSKSMDS